MRRIGILLVAGTIAMLTGLTPPANAQVKMLAGDASLPVYSAPGLIRGTVSVQCEFESLDESPPDYPSIYVYTDWQKFPLRICTVNSPGNPNNGKKLVGIACSPDGFPAPVPLNAQFAYPGAQITFSLNSELPDSSGLFDAAIITNMYRTDPATGTVTTWASNVSESLMRRGKSVYVSGDVSLHTGAWSMLYCNVVIN
jgi:hypothetical protein